MYSKGRRKGTVRFSFTPDKSQGAVEVAVAGDFNAWQAIAMTRRRDGHYVAEVEAPANCQYKFIINGQWQTDPENGISVSNGMGSENSVAAV